MSHPDDPTRDLELLGIPPASLWPLSVTVHLTDRCNHSCDWCWFTRSSMEIDIDAAITSLDEFIAMGAREIIVSGGGEPLLHPKVGKLLVYLSSQRTAHVHRRLYTNGSLLAKHRLVEDAFDYVRVSLDAGGNDLHSQLHGTSRQAYPMILSSLSEMASRKPDLMVGVSMVIGRFNANSCDLLIRDCSDFNIPYILFKPLIRECQREEFPFGFKPAPSTSIVIRKPPLPKQTSTPPVEFFAKCITIAPNSGVYPCCHCSGLEFSISGVDGIIKHIGTRTHIDLLRRYASTRHPCRLHDLWISSHTLPSDTLL